MYIFSFLVEYLMYFIFTLFNAHNCFPFYFMKNKENKKKEQQKQKKKKGWTSQPSHTTIHESMSERMNEWMALISFWHFSFKFYWVSRAFCYPIIIIIIIIIITTITVIFRCCLGFWVDSIHFLSLCRFVKRFFVSFSFVWFFRFMYCCCVNCLF